MADNNITVDNGALTDYVPATDRVGSTDYQLVKLVNATEDSVTRTGVAADPLAVSVTAALPAGTNAIGKLAANSGVDIGDVTIDNAAGASAVNIQDGGNSITVDGTVGVSGTVTVASHAVTNAGVFVVQENGAALTSLQLIDDAVATTASAIPTKGLAVSGTDGTNARVLKTDASGELQVDVLTMPTTTVTGTVAVTGIGSTASDIGKAEDSAHVSGDVGVPAWGVYRAAVAAPAAADGDYVPFALDSFGCVRVSGACWAEDSLHANADIGTFPLAVRRDTPSSGVTGSGDYASFNVNASGQLYVEPSIVAHDAADAGNPVKVGGRARTTDITAVASDDRVDAIYDALGKQVVTPYATPENLVSGVTAAITDTTSTSVIASQGAGVRFYMTSLSVMNSHSTVTTVVAITDGSGGTVMWRLWCDALGGGQTITFPSPIRFSAATAVHAVCVTTGANVYVSIGGFKAAL